MANGGDIFVVTVTLDPKPLPSLGLDERFTRIDFTLRCTMLDVLESMARVLRVSREDLALESEADQAVDLAHTLGEYYAQYPGLNSSTADGVGKQLRREINLKVKHTPLPQQLVTCTVEGGQGRKTLRRATVRLPNTATFGELLESARKQRYGALDFEGPVYGRDGELDTTLREAWVRNGCKIDGTLHIGLAVVVSFMSESRAPLSLIMGPGDTIGGVKQRVLADQGHDPSTQGLTIRGAAQRLEDDVTLHKCCVSGVPVGGFSSAGWGELHLELHLNERVNSSLRVKIGGVSVSGDVDKWVRTCEGNSFFTHSNLKTLSIPSPEEKAAPGSSRLNAQHEQNSRAGSFTMESPSSSSDSADDHPTDGNRGDAYTTVMFALSPSGRALTLTMPPAATVLDAKEQVASLEGISPCRQRLLWRGNPMEPDSALLYKVGVRGGDTLIVGYRVSSVSTGAIVTHIPDLEGKTGDDILAGDGRLSRERPCSGGAEHCDNKSSDLDVSVAQADGSGRNTVPARECEEDCEGSARAGRSANAGAGNVGVGFVDDVQHRNEEGGEVAEDGTVSPPPPPPPPPPPTPPPSSTAGHGHGKSGRQRGWWSKSKTRTRRGRRDGSSEHGYGNAGRRGALGGVLLSCLPSSASSSSSTVSLNSNRTSHNTRAVRVSPASVAPMRSATANSIVRGIGSASTGTIYVPPTMGGTVGQQQVTQSGGRGSLSGWACWRNGSRVPASPISADDAHGISRR